MTVKGNYLDLVHVVDAAGCIWPRNEIVEWNMCSAILDESGLSVRAKDIRDNSAVKLLWCFIVYQGYLIRMGFKFYFFWTNLHLKLYEDIKVKFNIHLRTIGFIILCKKIFFFWNFVSCIVLNVQSDWIILKWKKGKFYRNFHPLVFSLIVTNIKLSWW